MSVTRRRSTTIATYGILLGAGAVSFVLPDTLTVPGVSAQAEDGLRLVGTVRDFEESHPDFNIGLSGEFGHVAGNAMFSLLEGDWPSYNASGYKVAIEWQDETARPIAPHLFAEPPAPIARILVDGPVHVRQGDIDGFDSTEGEFGGGNSNDLLVIMTNSTAPGSVTVSNNADIAGRILVGAGADPDVVVDIDGDSTVTGGTGTLSEPFEIPAVEAPSGLGASAGDKEYEGGTISTDLHVDDLTISKSETVWIEGDVTILCDDDFTMENQSTLSLKPGASLELYVGDDFTMSNQSTFNGVGSDPTRAEVYLLGSGTASLGNNSNTYMNLVAPDGGLNISNSGAMGGSISVGRLTINNGAARLHGDSSQGADDPQMLCGTPITDAEGAAGTVGDGWITSASSFGQWFRDVVGVNLSIGHVVTLADNGGVYEYLDDEFYPLDGRLFGNGHQAHNYFFTYTIKARFTFSECTGQFVEFQGGDGMWLYIDDQLVIDLGGSMTPTTQHLELDRLELADGEEYTFKLFYANRVAADNTVFRLRTNLELRQAIPVATVTANFD